MFKRNAIFPVLSVICLSLCPLVAGAAEPEWINIEIKGWTDDGAAIDAGGGAVALTVRLTRSAKETELLFNGNLLAATQGFPYEEDADGMAHGMGLSGSSVQMGWSPDGSRLAYAWSSQWHPIGGDGCTMLTTTGVAMRRDVASVDLLDAGGGSRLDGLDSAFRKAGFHVAHRGKAQTPRESTEIFFAAGFEAEAREIAKLSGAPGSSVKPLSWKSPYAITVAAGKK